MKKIPKKLLDKLICNNRKIWKNPGGSNDELHQMNCYLAKDIESVCGLDWLAVSDFVFSIIMRRGFRPNATNAEIYAVITLLGWEVVDDVEEHLAD